MRWNSLERLEQIEAIAAASAQRPQLIFKHSTRCGTSAFVLQRLERALDRLAAVADLHLLDLLAHRDVSNAVATRFAVHHESPQALVIAGGECTYAPSHIEIEADVLLPELRLTAAAER